MGVTDFLRDSLVRDAKREEGNTMSPKLRFIFATILTIAAFVALNSWAAVPKHESAAPTAAKTTIYRTDLWRVY